MVTRASSRSIALIAPFVAVLAVLIRHRHPLPPIPSPSPFLHPNRHLRIASSNPIRRHRSQIEASRIEPPLIRPSRIGASRFSSLVIEGASLAAWFERPSTIDLFRGLLWSVGEMEGSGEGSREFGMEGVGEGSTRWRGARLRKPRMGLTSWTREPAPEAEAEGSEADLAVLDGVSAWRRRAPRSSPPEEAPQFRLFGDLLEGREGSRDHGDEAREVIDLEVEEAGPSQSPLRRSMQRPASADAKRARRGTQICPEDDELVTSDAPQPRPDVPRSRLVAGAGSRGRLGRPRLHPQLGTVRRPSASGRDGNAVVDLVEPDSRPVPSMLPENTIVLDDDGEADRARQLAEDERVARELQDSFALEDLGGQRAPSDEYFARLLQDHENSHGRGLPIEQRPVFFAASGMRALLGGEDDEREARRLFRNEMAPDNAASSSRILRRAYGRNNALGRSLSSQFTPARDNANARHFPFPASMGLDRRMEVLAALEMAFQDQVPVGFQLAHVDRDFNENDYEMLLALDADNYRHRGASWETISQLPVTTLAPTDVTDEACSICLETPIAGDVIRRLPCMHAFHQACIDQWLQCQAVCPVCKAHI